jgi:hypothetical protein
VLVCFGSEGCLLVPRSFSTSVAEWAWPTWVVSRRRVLEAVFVLLESPSPSRIIFIGSHSLPPLWFAVSVLRRQRSRFSEHGTAAATLALSRNGSKRRPLGRKAALYNRDPALQRQPGLEVYPAQFSATQRSGTINGSFAQRLSSA